MTQNQVFNDLKNIDTTNLTSSFNEFLKYGLNFENLKFNLELIKKYIDPKTIVSPCLKANAYGHGLVNIAGMLTKLGVSWFSVFSPLEAKSLIGSGFRQNILLLGYFLENDIPWLVHNNIRLLVSTTEKAKEINTIAKKINKKAMIHISLDLGMSREGFLATDFIKSYQELLDLEFLDIEGLQGHFANCYGDFFNKEKLVLENQIKELKAYNLPIPRIINISKSETLFDSSVGYDLIRPGLLIYGYVVEKETKSFLEKQNQFPKPVLSLKTQIVEIKKVPKNSFVGYDSSYKCSQDTKIGTIPVGYSDGIPRSLGNKGFVLVNGQKCPILGKVCMNVIMIDITNVSAKIFDEVTLIGENQNETINLYDWEKLGGDFIYQCLTGFNFTKIFF